MSFFKHKLPKTVPRRRTEAAEQERSLDVNQTFRRNRTITGSKSALFGSAVEHKSDMVSPRAEVHDLAQKRRKILRALAITLAISAPILVLLWHFIATFSLQGSYDVQIGNREPYERVINEYFFRQPLQRFRLTLDEKQLTYYVNNQLPEVEKVRLKGVTGLGSSKFELTMRRPVAQWSLGGSDKFVDADGVSFMTNYYSMPDVQVIDNSGIDSTSGVALASSRFLGFVGRVVTLSQQNGYTLNSVIIPPATTRQIEIKLEGVAYPVKLSVDRPVGEQIEDMSRSIVYLQQNGISPQYIDIRISGRAYYR